MTDEDQKKGGPSDDEAAEKAVADAIEEAVGEVPASIEEQALEEAAELEELESSVSKVVEQVGEIVEDVETLAATGRVDEAAREAVHRAEETVDEAEQRLVQVEQRVKQIESGDAAIADRARATERVVEEAEEAVEEAEEEIEDIERRMEALEDAPLLAPIAPGFRDVKFEVVAPAHGPRQLVAHVSRERLVEFMAAVKDAGYRMFADGCGVDYLRRRPRFEMVFTVVAMDPPSRLRVRVGVPGDDPVVPTLTDLWPGANFFEREAYDMFGIEFAGHPDLTRILMPDDWEGHPLRKDYSVGSVPVQFKGAHKAS